ncbi:divalent-cation tolerance protein CutA [Craterilacuibacter sp.]|uniref:divalent-cation tolerance protein CutA n=1 Tax=Craterilacuibacter sp. TaxID=2870909 RepID=UPI003F386B51
MKILFVVCNTPSEAIAMNIARTIVGEKLAACANILAPCRSVYRWQGQVEEAQEVPLLIKTTASAYPQLEARLVELHPYEVPEIIALPLQTGLAAYLTWVKEQTLSSP